MKLTIPITMKHKPKVTYGTKKLCIVDKIDLTLQEWCGALPIECAALVFTAIISVLIQ